MKTLILIALLTFATMAHADRTAFCAGFTEGYKSVQGNRARVPSCPRFRSTRGQTDFRLGITAGIRAASR